MQGKSKVKKASLDSPRSLIQDGGGEGEAKNSMEGVYRRRGDSRPARRCCRERHNKKKGKEALLKRKEVKEFGGVGRDYNRKE